MTTSQPIGDEDLQRLVDGEITADERAELHAALQDDEALSARACEFARHKDLVRLAYTDVNPPQAPRVKASRIWAVAASVIITLILVVPASRHLLQEQLPPRVVLLDPDGSGTQLADLTRDETRIVMHLKARDVAQTGEILDELEWVLEAFRKESKPIRVELVAQGEGFEMVRMGFSRFPDRIRDLAERYDNLTFIACQNTIDRISREQGVEVDVLPQVVITGSGVNHVAKRQNQGWAYMRI